VEEGRGEGEKRRMGEEETARPQDRQPSLKLWPAKQDLGS